MRFAALFLALFAGPALADGFCFGRFYDEDHMRAHPVQKVEEMFFGTVTGRPVLQVRLRTWDTYVFAGADCRETGGVLACDLENGLGNFTIEGRPDGTIMLRIGDRDVMLEPTDGQDIVFLLHDAGDDRAFRLYPGKGCIS